MIDKNVVKQLVEEWLDGKDYFLTDLTVSPDDRIVVEMDHVEGVWIEDCVDLATKKTTSWKWAVQASANLLKCIANMRFT